MKRLHLHVNVDDLDQSIRFYATLFGAEPTVRKPDYAKWMLDDPRVNLAISRRGRTPGVDHVGIQTETGEELAEIAARLKAAAQPTVEQVATTCCYAFSDKHWVEDPSGLKWETFHTFGESTTYGFGGEAPAAFTAPADAPSGSACCAG